MTSEPGLASHSTPVDAFLKNLFAWAPGFVRCFASRSSNGNMAIMPAVNAVAAMRSFVVNRGAGVLALSALAFGGSAGCAGRIGALPNARTLVVTRVRRRCLTADNMAHSRP